MVGNHSFSSKHLSFIILFLSILAVYGFSAYMRQAGYRYWMDNRKVYVVDHVTAMSTMDAYYWLKMARDMEEGKLGTERLDRLQGYPDGNEYPNSANLLAFLISLGRKFTGGDYYRAALLLVPVLAGLFVFPLFFYFRQLGFGASAVLGGLLGSFSLAYYGRTATGWVDTDLLNVFFPLAASCFILLIKKERDLRANIGLAVGTGLSMYLFCWWYQQPGFILAYLLLLAVYLILGRIPWRQIALILLAFLLSSGPAYVMQSVESLWRFWLGYIAPPLKTGRIIWPNAMTFINEAQHLGAIETLKSIYGLLPVTFAGLVGLAYLCIRRWRGMVPITPLILLGIWSMVGQRRFAMYLAPLIGVGVGVLIELVVNYFAKKTKQQYIFSLLSIPLMFLLFFSTTAYTGFGVNYEPIISAPITRAFLDIKKIVPKHSAILTPTFDYGYPLMQIGEFATYHDGGLHGGIRTTLISKAVTLSQQSEMVSMLAYLEDYGFNHLTRQIRKDNLSGDMVTNLVFEYPGNFRGRNVYVLYLNTMIDKIGSISRYGTWDLTTGKSDPMRYSNLYCFSFNNDVLGCRKEKVDLDRGVIITNDKSREIPLKAVLFVNNGYVVKEKKYKADKGYIVQILEKDNKAVKIQLLDERLFRTNFNQQYLLGNYDRRYFEEVYNNFPVARLLKVK